MSLKMVSILLYEGLTHTEMDCVETTSKDEQGLQAEA